MLMPRLGLAFHGMVLGMVAAWGWAAMAAEAEAKPRAAVPVIFDTDLGNDVDDAVALAMLHALQSRGECRIIAVTITKDHELAGPFADCINMFYGRGEIPVGVVKGSGVTPEAGRYNRLAEEKDAGGQYRYPHRLLHGADAPDAVAVLRAALAAEADGTVAIAQVGFSTNLARLLDSKPDAACNLDGTELVKRKVKLLSVMAGAFAPIQGKRHLEYNVIKDIPSAKRLVAGWPTPIVFSGYEIGLSIPYPSQSIVRDYAYVPHHPVAEAYWLYNPPPHNRPTWDPTAALYAVRPEHGYFGVSEPGRLTVEDDGGTRFTPAPGGPHRYLTVNPEQVVRTQEAIVELASQPPGLGQR